MFYESWTDTWSDEEWESYYLFLDYKYYENWLTDHPEEGEPSE